MATDLDLARILALPYGIIVLQFIGTWLLVGCPMFQSSIFWKNHQTRWSKYDQYTSNIMHNRGHDGS
jgi:hypothetical protein